MFLLLLISIFMVPPQRRPLLSRVDGSTVCRQPTHSSCTACTPLKLGLQPSQPALDQTHNQKRLEKPVSPPTSLGAVLPSSSTHLSLCDHRRIARVRHVATRELSACCRPSFAVSGGSSIANVRPSAATKGPAELLQPEICMTGGCMIARALRWGSTAQVQVIREGGR